VQLGLQALDASILALEHRLCVRHRCVAPVPLAVPLPFPDILTGGGPGAAGPGAVAVLSRLQRTLGFEPWVRNVVQGWDRARVSTAGRAVADEWGLAPDDCATLAEQLQALAACCAEEEDE
jgi:hypothetical protein